MFYCYVFTGIKRFGHVADSWSETIHLFWWLLLELLNFSFSISFSAGGSSRHLGNRKSSSWRPPCLSVSLSGRAAAPNAASMTSASPERYRAFWLWHPQGGIGGMKGSVLENCCSLCGTDDSMLHCGSLELHRDHSSHCLLKITFPAVCHLLHSYWKMGCSLFSTALLWWTLTVQGRDVHLTLSF